jgi:hypothetical protein
MPKKPKKPKKPKAHLLCENESFITPLTVSKCDVSLRDFVDALDQEDLARLINKETKVIARKRFSDVVKAKENLVEARDALK